MSDKPCQKIKKEVVKTEEVKTEEVETEEVKTEEYKEEEGEESKVCRSDGDDKKPFTILEHMSVIQKIKEMTEQARRGSSQKLFAKLKNAKTDTVEKLYKEGIFQKTDQSSSRCVSCCQDCWREEDQGCSEEASVPADRSPAGGKSTG